MPQLLTAKALREQRAEIAKTIRQLADKVAAETRDFSAEEKPNWEKCNADYNALTRQIEIAERVEQVDTDQRSPADRDPGPGPGREDRDGRRNPKDRRSKRQAPTEEDRAVALQAWCRTQSGVPLTKQHRAACERTGLNPRRRNLDLQLTKDYRSVRQQFRAQSAITVSAGAALVAPSFMHALEVAMLQFGGMRQVAEVIRTDTGAEMPWPTANDTGNEGEIVGENNAPNTQDIAVANVKFQAYKYSSKIIKVPVELLEDSAFDFAAFMGGACGERISRRQNRDYTVGTGASQPWGIVPRSTLGKTAASATVIAADELFDLVHSVDPAYRIGAGWMFHDNILLVVRKLKDSQNRYLWEPNVQLGEPDRLLNYPLTINQSMASAVATTNITMLFGQLSKYKIRDVAGIRMRRLVERYADTDQEGFVMFQRSDGNLLDAGVAPVKHLKQA